jgi:hypothetical protein
MNKKIILTLLLIAITMHTAIAVENPVTDVTTITEFETIIFGGEANLAEFEFTGAYETPIIIRLEIQNDEIGYNEWVALFSVNGEPVVNNETYAGVFDAPYDVISGGNYKLQILYVPVVEIVPGNYTFELLFGVETEEVQATTEQSSSGGHGSWYYFRPVINDTVPDVDVIETVEIVTVETEKQDVFTPTETEHELTLLEPIINTGEKKSINVGNVVLVCAVLMSVVLMLVGYRMRKD